MGYTYKGYEAVIGLEVHVQLDTESKIFSRDLNQYGGEPNTHIHPVTLALPGTLPKVNIDAIHKAVKLAYAIESKINVESRFDRKHYHYPDLPKGYQITQNFLPICEGGQITFHTSDSSSTVRFHHVHMEEDAGKSQHLGHHSVIDLNRAGTPLLEIVTEPDLRSGEEVYYFIQELQRLVRWLKVSNADMEKGELRCDCNVSVRKIGATNLGERCEIKNLNSKKFAREAVEVEAKSQIEAILAGDQIYKTTLHYDPKTKKTTGTRSKEDAKDYRYVPDPDLPPVLLKNEDLQKIKEELPALPDEEKRILIQEHILSEYQANQICSDIDTLDYYKTLVKGSTMYPQTANLIINHILPHQKEANLGITQVSIEPTQIQSLLKMIEDEVISHNAATKQVLPALFENPKKSTEATVDELNLRTNPGQVDVQKVIADALEDCQAEVDKYKNGKKALFGFFMGEVMKKSNGKIQPKEIKDGLMKYLSS